MGEDETTTDDDGFDKTTEARWATYKRQCREQGTEPMTWGKWLAAGEPNYG